MKGMQPTDRVQEALGKYLDRIVYMPVVHLDKEGALEAIADFRKRYVRRLTSCFMETIRRVCRSKPRRCSPVGR